MSVVLRLKQLVRFMSVYSQWSWGVDLRHITSRRRGNTKGLLCTFFLNDS